MKNIITKDDLIGNFIKSNNSDIMWMPFELCDKKTIQGYKLFYVKDHRYFGRISWAILQSTLDAINYGDYKFIRLDGKE